MAHPGRPSHDETVAEPPGAGAALIGAAFGILLLYVGTLIPYKLLRWPTFGLGAVFVVVMIGYLVAVLRKRISGPFRRSLDRMRGHVRNDPQLGTLRRFVNARCWVGAIRPGGWRVEIVIEGDDEPNAVLLQRAREVVAELDVLQRRAAEYLNREAAKALPEDPHVATEIRALRISSIGWRSPERPSHILIEFDGPEEMRYWTCEYVDGELSNLAFDT